ncbi:epoxide hydrolase family protein [Streptomyces sp. AC495_CC817]|uniref:epoxide hydrolase family protein n=1 Tax=Streptomyces sp. AC495_CC817 TaxID=2823900 RepID=UPI001C26416A|nr:epoxide hydrolase family protein [Streptomyces sp. AC495_CC817]
MNTTSNSIRPFRIDVAQGEIDDLRARLAGTRWPQELPGVGWSRGVPTSYLRRIAEYWQGAYDWRAAEERLNELPQFLTEIDGQQLHFAHIRSEEPGARPLLMVHGWPSSFAEFSRIVGPLTDPVAYGGRAEDAVHLVLPSIPGFGFSPLAESGRGDLLRVASAFAELMTRLGYDRFLAQGTDAGAGIVGLLPMVAPGRVIATHVNGPAPAPFGPPLDASALSGRERERAEAFNAWQQDGTGYLAIQSTRPQTLSYGLTDSPVAQLAWIIEKFREWTDPAAELPEDAVDLDDLLTLVSLYWFGELGWSSAHSLAEGMETFRRFAPSAAEAPTGDEAPAEGGWEMPPMPPASVAVFAADMSVRSAVDPYGAVGTWNEYEVGGHFPAMEAPEVLVADIRSAFRGA